jgi:hypothetical protein
MARVTIEGSVTPSTYLSRGKRTTVERTPFIDKLIRKGFVNVVQTHDATPRDVVTEIEQHTDEVKEAARLELKVRPDDAPARNASTEEWAQFLEDREIAFPEGSTRADLIARWDAVNADG